MARQELKVVPVFVLDLCHYTLYPVDMPQTVGVESFLIRDRTILELVFANNKSRARGEHGLLIVIVTEEWNERNVRQFASHDYELHK